MVDQVVQIARCVAGGLAPRVWVVCAVAVVLAAMVPSAAVAQDGPQSAVRVSFTSDRATLTVGDLVTLTLEVTHPADHVAVVPRLDPEWGSFEVIAQSAAQIRSNGDGTETTSRQLTVTIFAPGEFQTPSLPITVRAPNGSVERLVSPPVRLTVESVLSGSEETLKDIRSPADLSPPLWKQPASLAIASLAAVAAIALVAYFVHKYLRARDAQPASEVDTRTPWEIAIQEIEEIERLDLPGEGRFTDHYTLVAGVTKAYVCATYLDNSTGTGATDMTTDETVTAIWQSSLDRKNARLVADLLLEADLVRFSNYSPPASQAHEALSVARRIVEGTEPPGEETALREDSHSRPEAKA